MKKMAELSHFLIFIDTSLIQLCIKRMKSKSMVFTSQGYIGGLTRSPSKEEDPESIRNPIRRASSCWDGLGSPTPHYLSERECGETRAPTQFSPRDTFGQGACDSRRGHTGLSSSLGSLAPHANHVSYLISLSVDLLFCEVGRNTPALSTHGIAVKIKEMVFMKALCTQKALG